MQKRYFVNKLISVYYSNVTDEKRKSGYGKPATAVLVKHSPLRAAFEVTSSK